MLAFERGACRISYRVDGTIYELVSECAKKGENVTCGIYEWRPAPCNELELDCYGCEKARALHMLQAFQQEVFFSTSWILMREVCL
jgi:hypothetical protein